MAYHPLSLRMTLEEDAAIRAAAEALELTASQLVEFAFVEAAHRLGFFENAEPKRASAPEWLERASHREESATQRLTISISPPNFQLLQRTAQRLDAAPTWFAVGATLQHIGTKQRLQPDDKKLQRIKLPARWRTA